MLVPCSPRQCKILLWNRGSNHGTPTPNSTGDLQPSEPWPQTRSLFSPFRSHQTLQSLCAEARVHPYEESGTLQWCRVSSFASSLQGCGLLPVLGIWAGGSGKVKKGLKSRSLC